MPSRDCDMNKKQRLQKKLHAIWGIKKRPRYQEVDASSVVPTDESPLSNPISAHLKNAPSELKRIMGWTLSQLINEKWQDEEPRVDASYPVRHMFELYQTKVSNFTVEDVRFLIGQKTALEQMVPLSLYVLDDNILASGDFYDGDLLQALLRVPVEYWEKHTIQMQTLLGMLKANEAYLEMNINDKDLLCGIKGFIAKYE